MRALAPVCMSTLAADWSMRLAAESQRFPAIDIYGGRGFAEAVAAAEILGARLFVVSAGLGLIDASTMVPPYACTVVANAADNVALKVTNRFTLGTWWATLRDASPFNVILANVVRERDGLILAALSDAYINLISTDLLSLPLDVLAKFRLFTRTPADRIAERLQPYLMPYDDRLNGPDSPTRGTLSDFASRALRHFASLLPEDDRSTAAEHASTVSSTLAGWRYPTKITRARYDDEALLKLIREHWNEDSSRSLRRLRDEFNIACEHGRYSRLARIIRSERA